MMLAVGPRLLRFLVIYARKRNSLTVEARGTPD
jgi:hypothetical protein